jgi:hypothetical protein
LQHFSRNILLSLNDHERQPEAVRRHFTFSLTHVCKYLAGLWGERWRRGWDVVAP